MLLDRIPEKNFPNNHLVTLSVSDELSILTEQLPPNDTDWGLDYVEFSFMVNPDLCSLTDSMWTWEGIGKHRDSDQEYSTHIANVQFGDASVKIKFKPEQTKAYVSFNPSRALKPKSTYLLPPAALSAVINALLDQIHGAVHPLFDRVDSATGQITRDENWVSEITVHRLDVARNFIIDELPMVKAHLINATPRYGKINHLYWDRNGGWTLQNSTKKVGHDRIYDKYAELNGVESEDGVGVAEGTFRFESQLHKDRLKKFGLKTLDQVTDYTVWNALKTRWEACNWDVQLPESGTVVKALEPLSVALKEGLIGYLFLASQGATSCMTKEHIRERNRLARQYGLQPGIDLYELGEPTRQLDLQTGRLIPISSAG